MDDERILEELSPYDTLEEVLLAIRLGLITEQAIENEVGCYYKGVVVYKEPGLRRGYLYLTGYPLVGEYHANAKEALFKLRLARYGAYHA